MRSVDQSPIPNPAKGLPLDTELGKILPIRGSTRLGEG